jgi:hypothetical protein
MALPVVRESWGLEDDQTPEEFADMVYGVKLHYSGGPGYNGDLYRIAKRENGTADSINQGKKRR